MNKITKNTNDFVQITRGYIQEMRVLALKSPVAHQILWLFTERMNRTNAIVISQATISSILGVHRSTVNRALSVLESARWIQIIKLGTANGYVVNSKVLWRANNRDGKRYATFHADVIASEDDQKHPIEDWDNVELRQIPVINKNDIPVKGNDELPPPDQQELIDNISDQELVKITDE